MSKESHNLFREALAILKPFRLLITLAAILGIIGGLSITGLLATINNTMNMEGDPNNPLILTFAGLCLLVLTCTTLSNLAINYVGQHLILKMRQRLAGQILLAPIAQLERYRSHRLIPVLVHDVDTVSGFALDIAPLVISFAVSLGCLSYLAFLSWEVLLLTLLTVIIGSGAQYLAYRLGSKDLDIARDAEDDLQKHYQTISEGAKELRIQRPRRQHMFNTKIQETTERICKANIRSANIFISAETFGSLLFFVVIGMAITFQALFPSTDKTMLGGFVLVMLYMKGPLEHLVSTLPNIAHAQVAFKRIADLSEQFSSPEPHLLIQKKTDASSKSNDHTLQSLELKEVNYEFPAVGELAPFKLGPINIHMKKGDIVFIVGENGSGKTTLIKLLLGLYTPHTGNILINNKPVISENLDDYRQLFTTIFSDYHLFEELANGHQELPKEADRYLKLMSIDHKVSIRNGAFTTTDLSTGQRKRLALINAWLEQRPVLIFDEWAADQDPAFRRVFYTELLPELQSLGKTIIVISHDDQYFNVADQIIKVKNGAVMTNPLLMEQA